MKIFILFLSLSLSTVIGYIKISKRKYYKNWIIPIHRRIKYFETNDETFLDIEQEYTVIDTAYFGEFNSHSDPHRIGELSQNYRHLSIFDIVTETILSTFGTIFKPVFDILDLVLDTFRFRSIRTERVPSFETYVSLTERQGISGSSGLALLTVATAGLGSVIQEPLGSAIASVDLSNTPLGNLTNTPISELQTLISETLTGKGFID